MQELSLWTRQQSLARLMVQFVSQKLQHNSQHTGLHGVNEAVSVVEMDLTEMRLSVVVFVVVVVVVW